MSEVTEEDIDEAIVRIRAHGFAAPNRAHIRELLEMNAAQPEIREPDEPWRTMEWDEVVALVEEAKPAVESQGRRLAEVEAERDRLERESRTNFRTNFRAMKGQLDKCKAAEARAEQAERRLESLADTLRDAVDALGIDRDEDVDTSGLADALYGYADAHRKTPELAAEPEVAPTVRAPEPRNPERLLTAWRAFADIHAPEWSGNDERQRETIGQKLEPVEPDIPEGAWGLLEEAADEIQTQTEYGSDLARRIRAVLSRAKGGA